MADYTPPTEVVSPKAHWHLVDVILDRGEGNCAYAIGTWDGERRIGFRWNGSRENGPIGNPQSRGLPTWTMLDPALSAAVIELLPSETQSLARRFLGISSNAASREKSLERLRQIHQEQVAKIISAGASIPTLGHGLLVMHVLPLSIESPSSQQFDEILKRPDRFAPIGGRTCDSAIDSHGLLTGSNEKGLRAPQRAYVRVWRSGSVEAVVSSLARGPDRNLIVLPTVQAMIIKYARDYAMALDACGIAPPVAVLVSLAGVKGMRLLQDFEETAFTEDMPFSLLNDHVIHFSEAILDTVSPTYNESAKVLMPTLRHLAQTSGLRSPPYFDSDGNYTARLL